MAREKNTYRADARRRARATARQNRETRPGEFSADTDGSSEAAAPVAAAGTDERPTLFKMPHVREDIAALPEMFRTRRLLWVPFILLLVGFGLALLEPFQGLDANLAGILSFYVQTFFIPTGLLTFLVAGFLARRAAYLVGFLVGVANALLLVVAFGLVLNTQIVAAAGDQASTAISVMIGYALLIGPLAAAFASWYRNFLNRMNSQGQQRRLAREAELAKQRKEEARAARRPQRSGSTSR